MTIIIFWKPKTCFFIQRLYWFHQNLNKQISSQSASSLAVQRFAFPPFVSPAVNSWRARSLLQSNCAQYAADRREEEKMCDHLISAAKHRDHVTANQLKQKILNILTNKHGAWGTMSQRWEELRVKLHCGTFLDYHYTGCHLTGGIILAECSHGTLLECNERTESAASVMYSPYLCEILLLYAIAFISLDTKKRFQLHRLRKLVWSFQIL